MKTSAPRLAFNPLVQHSSLSLLGERYLLRQPTAFHWGHGRVVSVLEARAMLREHEDDPRLRADLRAALPDAGDGDPFDVLRRAMESDQVELVLDPIPRTVVLADACVPTTTALGELVGPCAADELVEQHATGLEDELSPELAFMLLDGEGKRMGTTLDGQPIEYSITMPNGRTTVSGHLDADGVARRPIPEEGPCAIELVGLGVPDRVPTTAGPFVRAAQATLVSRRDARRPLWRNTQPLAHVFQLERRRAAVVELEHFTADGAVFLPGAAPSVLREGAARVTGLDALRATLARARGKHPLVICGHHPSRSLERAQSVRHLLVGDRSAWAALSVGVATPADVEAVLRWAAEELEWPCDPIPGIADDAAIREFQRAHNEEHAPKLELTGTMDEATWGAVFDVMLEQLAPPAPPPAPRRHKLVIRAVGEDPSNIYPVKMAEITWGGPQAGRAQELGERVMDGQHIFMITDSSATRATRPGSRTEGATVP
jgi:hypothetical protein